MSRLRPVSLLPSLATLGNLACGVAALIWTVEAAQTGELRHLTTAGLLLLLAMLLDAVDGKLARLTKGASDLGAQLDSLADAVTFGVVPGILARTLVILEGPGQDIRMHPRLLMVAPILYSACAVLRLARFNVEHQSEDPNRDHARFAGLPSPAAAAAITAMVLFYFAVADPDFLLPLGDEGIHLVQSTVLMLLPFSLIALAVLMVTHVPYPHMVAWLTRARRPFPVVAEVVLTLGVLLVEPEFAILLGSLLFVCLPLFTAAHDFLIKRRVNLPSKSE